MDAGLDSLDVVQLVAKINDRIRPLSIPQTIVFDKPNPHELGRALYDLLSPPLPAPSAGGNGSSGVQYSRPPSNGIRYPFVQPLDGLFDVAAFTTPPQGTTYYLLPTTYYLFLTSKPHSLLGPRALPHLSCFDI